MTHVICNRCKGTGKRPLVPALELVYRQLLTRGPGGPWKDFVEIYAKVTKAAKGSKMSRAALAAKLAKLVTHGLVERQKNGRLYWRAK